MKKLLVIGVLIGVLFFTGVGATVWKNIKANKQVAKVTDTAKDKAKDLDKLAKDGKKKAKDIKKEAKKAKKKLEKTLDSIDDLDK
jgi:hypothetical protein